MNDQSPAPEIVFDTKWFQIVARRVAGDLHPHYVINCTDFVAVVAVTTQGELLLVRQFRAARGAASLEVPSGHVEIGETPEEAARKELLEETGYVAEKFELLRTLAPCIGRFSNQMWCYLALDARPTTDPDYQFEAGVELVKYCGSLRTLLAEPEFCSSLSHTALLAALAQGRIGFDGPQKPA